MEGQRCNWPHGRGLGGSSIINYMIYTRGNKRDFDRIAAAGNPGWSFDHILPLYQKIERSLVEPMDDTDSFGKTGLLQIEEARFRTPIARAFVESAIRLNYSHVNYNSGDQIGVSYLHSSTKNGWRQTAARAFLSPIRNRPNLDISLRTWATKLLFNVNGDQVKAIKFVRNRREYTVKVRKEVILAAGAFETPKLLMLSGIGPEEHLKDLNIKVIKNLPVGQTLHEHMAVFGPIFTADNVTDGLVNMNDVLQLKPIFEMLEGKGPMTSTGIESLLYMKTNNSISSDPGYPDIELLQSFATIAFDTSQGTREGIRLSQEAYDAVFKPLENRRSFQVLPMLLHPRSKGHLRLKSRNPFHHPLMYPNFFADSRDIDTLLDGIREIIKIAQQPEFKALGVELYNATFPGCDTTEFNSDEYWRCYIRHLSATLHHQVGTCKMGPHSDQTAVVDSHGRVHGFRNLRVADISILPESPSGHTAAFSFVIGEKIADIIRTDSLPKESNIQRLTRIRKSLDWLYQDPEHTTEVKPVTTTATKRLVLNQPFTTATPKQTMNADVMHALHSLNMSAIHENSQQFKHSTVGDVGVILWGSPMVTKTIDFKSKLAELSNSTSANETKRFELKQRIIKPTSTTIKTTTLLAVTENLIESVTDEKNKEENDDETKTLLTSSFENATRSNETVTIKVEPVEKTTVESSTKLSNMDRIMATAPSLNEDAVNTYKLKEIEKRRNSKVKFAKEYHSEPTNLTSVPNENATDSSIENTTTKLLHQNIEPTS
ncbi:glucose dehydrogenase [FAD, quinone]-like isoform X2 [Sitodiplosis mosellana]|nr:glucose dehydrogenase [FAD, quinone]-like isoform X2 [Sitodiplosis mosellana]